MNSFFRILFAAVICFSMTNASFAAWGRIIDRSAVPGYARRTPIPVATFYTPNTNVLPPGAIPLSPPTNAGYAPQMVVPQSNFYAPPASYNVPAANFSVPQTVPGYAPPTTSYYGSGVLPSTVPQPYISPQMNAVQPSYYSAPTLPPPPTSGYSPVVPSIYTTPNR